MKLAKALVVQYSRANDIFCIETMGEMLTYNIDGIVNGSFIEDFVPLKICKTKKQAIDFILEISKTAKENGHGLIGGDTVLSDGFQDHE